MRRMLAVSSVLVLMMLVLAGCFGPTPYTISGVITDAVGDGVADLTIEVEGFGTATTDENGEWSMVDVKGEVVVTPVSDDYFFTPANMTVNEANADVVNFVASLDLDVVSGEIQILYTSVAPEIDGLLDDAAWGLVPWNDTFYNLANEEPQVETRVKALWDEDALYVAFKNYQPADTIVDDGASIWAEDNNEIYLSPETGAFFQLAVNTKADRVSISIDGDSVNDDKWHAAVDIQDDYFTVEIKVEWDAIGFTPELGDEWAINLTRLWFSGEGEDAWITWSPNVENSFGTYDALGVAQFM